MKDLDEIIIYQHIPPPIYTSLAEKMSNREDGEFLPSLSKFVAQLSPPHGLHFCNNYTE